MVDVKLLISVLIAMYATDTKAIGDCDCGCSCGATVSSAYIVLYSSFVLILNLIMKLFDVMYPVEVKFS